VFFLAQMYRFEKEDTLKCFFHYAHLHLLNVLGLASSTPVFTST
jgi:hypothetical protein